MDTDKLYAGAAASLNSSTSGFPIMTANSPVLSVAGGDYFELVAQTQSDTSVDISSSFTWFAIEVLE
jgi:hypothetical protein